jgi:hypothetical protein
LEALEEFKAILLEGVFSLEDDGEAPWGQDPFVVDPTTIVSLTEDHGKQSLVETLKPQIDQRVTIALHHFPPVMPPDPEKWGGGSCLLQPMEWCQFGHHEHPHRFFSLSLEGILRQDGTRWFIEKFDGTEVDLPFAFLVGHYSRVACATMIDVDKMKESLEKLRATMPGQKPDIDPEVLGVDIAELKDMLGRLEKITQDG